MASKLCYCLFPWFCSSKHKTDITSEEDKKDSHQQTPSPLPISPPQQPQQQHETMWNSKKKSSSSRSRQPTIDEAAAGKMFEEIADSEDQTVASMEGICTLCEKLDIDPLEDIRVLVLLWKLGSKEKPAQITKDEWLSGCNKLQVDSLKKLKDLLPSLETGFLDQTEFKDFYKVRKYVILLRLSIVSCRCEVRRDII